MEEKIKEKLEELFGEAYEIGHAHGRMDEKYIDIGWHKPFKEALKVLEAKSDG